ncbi:MAG: tetratricopeptide repeat protein [Planctomycetes bacterium]|nr:tetratricopeptide repeat protein [Planctomycetota bacterium]
MNITTRGSSTCVLLFLIVGGSSVAFGCGEANATESIDAARACLQRGLGLIEQQDVRGAIREFRTGLRLDPKHFDLRASLGAALSDLGERDHDLDLSRESLEVLEQLTRDFGHRARAWANLGTAYGRLGRFEEERQAQQKALELDPDNANLHYNLGVCAVELRDTVTAIAAFRRACELDPDDVDARANLAGLFLNEGRDVEAEELFEAVLRVVPEHRDVRYNSALLAVRRRDWVAAERHANVLARVDPARAKRLRGIMQRASQDLTK